MAKKKISELPAAATTTGTEILPIVQGGNTVKATVSGLMPWVHLTSGLTGTPSIDTPAVQAKLNSCRVDGRTAYFGPQSLSTDATLQIDCAVISDDNAIINTDAAVAIQIGTSTVRPANKIISLPRIQRTTQAWSPATATIGTDIALKIVQARQCEIRLPLADNWSIGAELAPTGGGHISYNRFPGWVIEDAAIGIRIKPGDTTAFANSNLWEGGAIRHNTGSTYRNVVGTRQIVIEPFTADTGFLPDHNIWMGTVLESVLAERHLDVFGSDNAWAWCRWEDDDPPITRFWGFSGARPSQRNQIYGGFNIHNISLVDGGNQNNNGWSISTGTLRVNQGTILKKHLMVSGFLDFPSIPAGGSADLTMTVTGAAVGDDATAHPNGIPTAGLMWGAVVSAANTVTVRLVNVTAAAIDPALATWRVNVWGH